MAASIREHVRHNVVGYIAIFLVVAGGTAYAVDGPNPGQNTIGSEDIIGNEVKSDDIGNGRIFNLDIADEVITGQKVKDGTIAGSDVDESTLSKVPNADQLDGIDSEGLIQGNGRIISNRVISQTQGTSILNIPFMGEFMVDGCDHTNGRIAFDTKGTGNVYMTVVDGGNIVNQGVAGFYMSGTAPSKFLQIQIARDAGANTKLAQVTLSWNAQDCVFAAQAIQTPSL